MKRLGYLTYCNFFLDFYLLYENVIHDGNLKITIIMIENTNEYLKLYVNFVSDEIQWGNDNEQHTVYFVRCLINYVTTFEFTILFIASIYRIFSSDMTIDQPTKNLND